MCLAVSPPGLPASSDLWNGSEGTITVLGDAQTRTWLRFRNDVFLAAAYTGATAGRTVFNNGSATIRPKDGISYGDFSVAVLASAASAGGNGNVVINQARNDNSENASFRFQLNVKNNPSLAVAPGFATIYSYQGGVGSSADSTSGLVDGGVHWWSFSRLNGGYTLYRDGVNATGNSSSAGISDNDIVSAGTYFGIGGLASGAVAVNATTIGPVLCWNRALDAAEHLWVAEHPEQLFLA
jgi:hypothetical protein